MRRERAWRGRHWVENPVTKEQVLDRRPLGRVADPKDVAGAAVFFCAPALPPNALVEEALRTMPDPNQAI